MNKNNVLIGFLLLFICVINAQTKEVDSTGNNLYNDMDFSLYDLAKDSTVQNYKTSNTGSTEISRNTIYGESRFDYGLLPNVSLNEDKNNLDQIILENRAHNRNLWITKGLTIVGICVLIILGVVFIFRYISKNENQL